MAKLKPRKGEYGFIQGTCDRCPESNLPLIRVGSEFVCDTCANTIVRIKNAKKRILEDDKDKDFINRAINEI